MADRYGALYGALWRTKSRRCSALRHNGLKAVLWRSTAECLAEYGALYGAFGA
jgi:hypothetical protein